MSNKRDLSQVPAGTIKEPEKRSIDPYEVPSHFADDPDVQATYAGHPSHSPHGDYTPESEEAHAFMNQTEQYEQNEPQQEEEFETDEPYQPEPQEAPAPKKGGHFKALKESYERDRLALERQLEEYKQREAELLKSLRPQAAPKQIEPEIEEDLLPIEGDESNLVELRDMKKFKEGVNRVVEKKVANVYKQLEEQNKQLRLINARARISAEMPDYSSVVNPSIFEHVEKTNPEFIEGLIRLDDEYKQAAAMYKYVKSAGIHNKVGVQQQNRSRIEQNLSKPRNSNVSTSLSQSSKYENMSRSEREAWLIQQNEEAIRSRRM